MALIILGVGYVMSPSDISSSQAGSGLVTADAMDKSISQQYHVKSIDRRWYVWNRYKLELLFNWW